MHPRNIVLAVILLLGTLAWCIPLMLA